MYSAAQAVVALQRGSVLAALTAAGLAVFMSGAIAAVAINSLASSKLNAISHDRGTTLRANPFAVCCLVIALVGAAFGSGFYVVFIRPGGAELPFAAPGRGLVNQFLMSSLLVISLIGLAALIKRREPGYLRIGRDGIENADIFRTRTARWDDIVDITDKADRQTRNPIVFGLKGAKPIVVPNAASYAAGSPRCTGWSATTGSTPRTASNSPTAGHSSASAPSNSRLTTFRRSELVQENRRIPCKAQFRRITPTTGTPPSP